MLLTIELETNLVISIITLLVDLFKTRFWIRLVTVPQSRPRRDNRRRQHSGPWPQTHPVRRKAKTPVLAGSTLHRCTADTC
jgi:hypothetical protein